MQARWLLPWMILIAMVLVAGYGVNLIRVGLFAALNGSPHAAWILIAGVLLMLVGTTFLGGFIYYRDKKRGRLKRPDWKSPKDQR